MVLPINERGPGSGSWQHAFAFPLWEEAICNAFTADITLTRIQFSSWRGSCLAVQTWYCMLFPTGASFYDCLLTELPSIQGWYAGLHYVHFCHNRRQLAKWFVPKSVFVICTLCYALLMTCVKWKLGVCKRWNLLCYLKAAATQDIHIRVELAYSSCCLDICLKGL